MRAYFGTFHFGIRMELSIAILLWRQKIKYRLLSNYLFQAAQEHGG